MAGIDPRQRHDARHRQDRGQDHDDGHEDAAVDEALRGAAMPLPIGRRVGRRRAVEGIDREAGHDIDDRPEAGLGQGGGRDRHESLDRPEAAGQHRQVRDMGRHDGVERRAEQQRVEAPIAGEAAGHEEAADPDRHFAKGEEDDHPADHEVHGFGQSDPAGRDAAEVVHHPAVADRHQQVEQQRQEHERHTLPKGEVAAGLDHQGHRGADVDQHRDDASGRRQTQHVGPLTGKLPHREVRIARRRREGQDDGIGGDMERILLHSRPAAAPR